MRTSRTPFAILVGLTVLLYTISPAKAGDYPELNTADARPIWDKLWAKSEFSPFALAMWCYRDKTSEMIGKLKKNTESEEQFSKIFLSGGGYSGAGTFAVKICNDAFQRLPYFNVSDTSVNDAEIFVRAIYAKKTREYILSCDTEYCARFKSMMGW